MCCFYSRNSITDSVNASFGQVFFCFVHSFFVFLVVLFFCVVWVAISGCSISCDALSQFCLLCDYKPSKLVVLECQHIFLWVFVILKWKSKSFSQAHAISMKRNFDAKSNSQSASDVDEPNAKRLRTRKDTKGQIEMRIYLKCLCLTTK